MAENFRLKTKADIVTTPLSPDVIYEAQASTITSIVLGLVLSNKSSNVIQATVKLISTTSETKTNSGAAQYTETNETVTLLNAISIPNGSTLEMFAGQKLVLQQSDKITVYCNTASALDVALSLLEIDNT